MTDFDNSEQNQSVGEAVSAEPVEPSAEAADSPPEDARADPGAGDGADSGAAQAGPPEQQQEAAGSESEASVAAAPPGPVTSAADEVSPTVEEAPAAADEVPATVEDTPTDLKEAPAAVEETETPAAVVAEEQPAEIPTAEESASAAEQPAEPLEAAIEEADPEPAPSQDAEGEPTQEPTEQPEPAEAEAGEQQAVSEEAADAMEPSADQGDDGPPEAAETEKESQPSDKESVEPAAAEPTTVTPIPGMDWYIIHTYSTFEYKVRESLHTRAEAFGFSNRLGEILIPTEDVVEMRGGKKVTSKRLLYPGYVLLQLKMDDDLWHVVKNTPRVTGFVGGGHTPTPLTADEVNQILYRQTVSVEKPRPKLTFQKSDQVKIIDGPFTNFTGTVEEVNPDRNTLKVMVTIFGRGTPVELEHFQVEKERI